MRVPESWSWLTIWIFLWEQSAYVLSGFDGDEEPVIDGMLETVVGLAERIISEGEIEPITMTTTIKTNGTEEEL